MTSPSTSSLGTPFPKNFPQVVKTIFKRLFRVYAHIYHSHFQKIVGLGAEAHLNTCFKHFIYFVHEFKLIDPKELEPLKDLIDTLSKWFVNEFAAANSAPAAFPIGILDNFLPTDLRVRSGQRSEDGRRGGCSRAFCRLSPVARVKPGVVAMAFGVSFALAESLPMT